jgi:hypothetical protein
MAAASSHVSQLSHMSREECCASAPYTPRQRFSPQQELSAMANGISSIMGCTARASLPANQPTHSCGFTGEGAAVGTTRGACIYCWQQPCRCQPGACITQQAVPQQVGSGIQYAQASLRHVALAATQQKCQLDNCFQSGNATRQWQIH